MSWWLLLDFFFILINSCVQIETIVNVIDKKNPWLIIQKTEPIWLQNCLNMVGDGGSYGGDSELNKSYYVGLW